MINKMAQYLLEQTLQNRSFAGPFAYSNNAAQKVFAGSIPSVPVTVMMETLARMQSGHATEKHAYAMANTLSTGDDKVCNTEFKECCTASGATRLDQVDAGQLKFCADNWSTCNNIQQ
jgi:hypothetical protein